MSDKYAWEYNYDRQVKQTLLKILDGVERIMGKMKDIDTNNKENTITHYIGDNFTPEVKPYIDEEDNLAFPKNIKKLTSKEDCCGGGCHTQQVGSVNFTAYPYTYENENKGLMIDEDGYNYGVQLNSVSHPCDINLSSLEECEIDIDDKHDYLNRLAKEIFENNKAKGFWQEAVVKGTPDGEDFVPELRNTGELIALMHSELSEALEAARKDKMDDHLPAYKGLHVELADTLIRILDFCGAHQIPIGKIVREKVEYNKNRPFRHGKIF